MSRANDPVYPHDVVHHYYGGVTEKDSFAGISLREHFAAMAMQGVISASRNTTAEHIPIIARVAVVMADALIAELAKEQK